jgi:sulfur carrier protein
MTGAATIRLNGRNEPLRAATLAALLAEQKIDPEARGIAVALNGAVVPRAAWQATSIHVGDEIDIVRALQGG